MADPATLTAISSVALGTLAGSATASLAGGTAAVTPPPAAAPPPPAPPIQQPQGQKAGGASTASPQSSFVGASSLPVQSGYGQKSLLGT